MPRKWEYKVVSSPVLAGRVVMISEDYQDWLNDMDIRGWQFVGYMQRLWKDIDAQQFLVFRRPYTRKGLSNGND